MGKSRDLADKEFITLSASATAANNTATTLVNAALTTISVSGLNIQVTQSSGLSQTILGRLTCLNRE